MSGIADIAERLTRAEMLSAGVKRPQAEQTLAGRMGLARYSLEDLRYGRIKNLEAIGAKIRAAFAAECERQICALQQQLDVARKLDRPIDFDAVDGFLRAAKEALHGKAGE